MERVRNVERNVEREGMWRERNVEREECGVRGMWRERKCGREECGEECGARGNVRTGKAIIRDLIIFLALAKNSGAKNIVFVIFHAEFFFRILLVEQGESLHNNKSQIAVMLFWCAANLTLYNTTKSPNTSLHW